MFPGSRNTVQPSTSGTSRIWALIAVPALTIHLMNHGLMGRNLPPSANIYLFQPLFWSCLAAIAFLFFQIGPLTWTRPVPGLIGLAVLIGLFQLSLFFLGGMLFGYGQSAHSQHLLGLIGNLFYIGIRLLGVEMSRACILASLQDRAPRWGFIFVVGFFTLINIPLGAIPALNEVQGWFRFGAERLLPALAESFLATSLTAVSGPLAPIAYRGLIQGLTWATPILPDLPWLLNGFLGTMVPALGILTLRSQIENAEPDAQAIFKRGGSNSLIWISAAAVLLLFFFNGLLGVQPTLVVGESMLPTMQAGDIVISQEITPDEVRIGDVIRFRAGPAFVVHRVKAIHRHDGELRFLTRGDNNNVDDPLVAPEDLQGKVVLILPKIGALSLTIHRMLEAIR